jgi:hypothetical protein
MSDSMKRIVDAYVRLGNRGALEKLKAHRAKLVFDLKSTGHAFDCSYVLGEYYDDLSFIEEGIASLKQAEPNAQSDAASPPGHGGNSAT